MVRKSSTIEKPALATPGPEADIIFASRHLGKRWQMHPKVAIQRARQHGLPVLKFNARCVGVRLSDILQFEARIAKRA